MTTKTGSTRPVFLANGGTMYRIVPEDIVYLKADDKTCNLYIATKRGPIVLSGTFTAWQTKLGEWLVPVKRGVAVNPCHIKKIVRGEIFLTHGGEEISFYLSGGNMTLLTDRITVI